MNVLVYSNYFWSVLQTRHLVGITHKIWTKTAANLAQIVKTLNRHFQNTDWIFKYFKSISWWFLINSRIYFFKLYFTAVIFLYFIFILLYFWKLNRFVLAETGKDTVNTMFSYHHWIELDFKTLHIFRIVKCQSAKTTKKNPHRV